MTSIEDITERKRMEESLRARAERLALATSGARTGLFEWDTATGKMLWTEQHARLLGLRTTTITLSREYSYHDWANHIHPEDLPRVEAELRRCMNARTRYEVEYRVVWPDKSVHWLDGRGLFQYDTKGKPTNMFGVTLDITTSKRLEEELRRSRDELELRVQKRTVEMEKLNENLRKEIDKRKKFEADLKLQSKKILKEQEQRRYLSKKLVEILERERQDMARTLHDEVGQILTRLNMDLDYMMGDSSEHTLVKTDELKKIQKTIMESMDYISGLAGSFRPHILENLGLIPAIRNILQAIQEKALISCHLTTEGIPSHLDPEKALAMYRIVQEAVTNSLRYARAKHISVKLNGNRQFISLAIEDDGIGFKYDDIRIEKGRREKLGIMIMNERAVQVGGEFRIESQVGKGTRVIAEIPIK